MASRDRAAILQRRKLLIASALAGLAATHCEKTASRPCLSQAYEPPPAGDSGMTEPEPQAQDAGSFDDVDPVQVVEEPDAGEPPPQVCLSVEAPEEEDDKPKLPPMPCLSVWRH